MNSFVKAECYPMYKFPRTINGRVDRAKIILGPLIKSIEKVVYKHPAFIKNIPVHDRPTYILNKFSGPNEFFATDYSSFEASFKYLLVRIEYEVYSFFAGSAVAKFICYCFYLDNKCTYKYFTITVLFKRMSGDMNTSLGNGIINLICISFVMYQKGEGIMWAMYFIIIEGDDSLFAPTRKCEIVESDFAILGLKVKIEHHQSVNTASFCGQVFDLETMSVLTDPIKVLCRFGYADGRYWRAGNKTKMSLLRANAFSMLYQYSGCPVVGALARRLLVLTRGYHVKENMIKSYSLQQESVPLSELRAQFLLSKSVSNESREIVQRMFNLPISLQYLWEDLISKMQLGPLSLPGLRSLVHPDCVNYFSKYQVFEGYNPNNPEFGASDHPNLHCMIQNIQHNLHNGFPATLNTGIRCA